MDPRVPGVLTSAKTINSLPDIYEHSPKRNITKQHIPYFLEISFRTLILSALEYIGSQKNLSLHKCSTSLSHTRKQTCSEPFFRCSLLDSLNRSGTHLRCSCCRLPLRRASEKKHSTRSSLSSEGRGSDISHTVS